MFSPGKTDREIALEACIACDVPKDMEFSVAAAFEGGAATLELCAAMNLDGLTPSAEAVRRSRALFPRKGIMAMIRPRGGGFAYTPAELEEMARTIESLARAGADGVVFGVLDTHEEHLHEKGIAFLVKVSKDWGLWTTFHRAFDALQDPLEALKILKDLEVDRILTSGIPWGGRQPVLSRQDWLHQVIRHNGGSMQIVVAGGISPENVTSLLEDLLPWGSVASVHAYSGILEEGRTSSSRVALLKERLHRLRSLSGQAP